MSLPQIRYFAGLKAIPPGHFLARLNALVAKGEPALFYINYLGNQGNVLTMSEARAAGVLFTENAPSTHRPPAPLAHQLKILSPPSLAQYREAFEKVQEYLKAGESWLVNLSFATQVSLPDEPSLIFPHLTASLCLYVPNEFLCFSPEKFIEISGNTIRTRPMKGTSEVSDRAAFHTDAKEIAEHYTVTDLLRNDLGMVGSQVKVEKFRYSESIFTGEREIIQTSSLITAQLPPHWKEHVAEIIYTLLPAGSVTGAPKARTLQIIDAIENHKRGYYTGIAGYFDGKALRTWVLIRFIEISHDKFFYKSGGGITLYSQSEKEYDELLKKIYLPVVTA